MKCPNCRNEVSPEFNVCPWCDFKPKKCSKPEHQDVWLPAEARFCPRCGEPLEGGTEKSGESGGGSNNGGWIMKSIFVALTCLLIVLVAVNTCGNDEGSKPAAEEVEAPEIGEEIPRGETVETDDEEIDEETPRVETVETDDEVIDEEIPQDEMLFTLNGVSFKMILVEHGEFQMGRDVSDAGGSESPVHTVILTKDYYMGETEVTQELWQSVMGCNPSWFKGDNLPVEWVSWEDCQEFIKKLNQKTGKEFRLPTEAEWEFAARGGRKSKHYQYSGSNDIDEVAWYDGNIMLQAVKTKKPNELGIYDMSGNASEWCQDRFGYYEEESQTNPKGSASGDGRVRRGRCGSEASNCRVSYRLESAPDCASGAFGLRLALSE